MADLDVAVRLRFLTTGDEKLKAAARDLQAFGKASGNLSAAATGRLGGDLTKAWSASAKLGGALDKTAGAATRTAGALNRIGAEARDIDRARVAVDKLSKSTRALDGAQAKVGRNAIGRLAGTGARAIGGEGLVAAGAIGGALSRRGAALKAGALEAASRVSPEGYLLGAGGAVVAGATIGATTAAGLAAVGVATKEAINRQSAFVDIQKKVSLEAGQSWDMLDRKVRAVSTSIGMSYADAAAIFAQGGQGNVAVKDLDAFAMLGAKIATSWDIGAREAAQMLTEVKAQTGKTIPQLDTFANKINGLGDVSAAAEKDIGAMAQRALAGMQAAGVGEDESLALMTALRGVGMQDEVASRFLTQFAATLRVASKLQPGQLGALKEIGLTGKQLEQGMQTNAMGTILDFLDRVSKAKNPVGTIRDVLGQQWFDEGLRLAQAAPEIVRVLDYINGGAWRGSMDKAMTLELGTTEAKLNKLKESILDIAATAAKPIALPWLSEVADKWSAAAERFRNAQQRSEETRALAKPVGESMSAYEGRLRLDRPSGPPPKPFFQQIEGGAPHLAQVKGFGKTMLDASSFAPIAENVTTKADDLYNALQHLNTTVKPVVDAGAATGPLAQIAAAGREALGVLSSLRGISAPAGGGVVRMPASLTGAKPGAGGSTGSGAPAAPAPTTPGKQARRAGGNIYANAIHFHGVKDLAGAHTKLARLQDRRIRDARDSALHDLA
ncbi:phage tail tape measure protein [Methylocystis parvus]|uniref:phage tail tape measure protein n=1 Tax=Methylocystis parvus TaxID=134 RepID=UPI003C774E6C